jgi:hypothetical protein
MKSTSTLLFFLLLLACKPADHKATVESTAQPTNSGLADSLQIKTDQELTTSDTSSQVGVEETKKTEPLKPATPKVCNPNFTKIATPLKNHHVVYVSGFKQEEFKCWVLLEEYGNSQCNGSPCVVYFVDNAEVKIEPSLPHHMSNATLKSAGVGRFEYNGKYWEIKGASQWKREGKGYGYFNTDNQLGG